MSQQVSAVQICQGRAPPDFKEKCFRFCQNYLGGIWADVTLDNVEVTRIYGGLSNMLFRCSVASQALANNDSANAASDVVIKFYGQKDEFLVDPSLVVHNDATVSLLMSQNKMGPNLLGSSPDGQIMQYIKHHIFGVREQGDAHLVALVARKLARLHSMNVPVNRETISPIKTIRKHIVNARQTYPIDRYVDDLNLQTLKSKNIDREIDWIERQIDAIDCPLCFIHNDFRGSNILVIEDINANADDESIVFCDFESSGYGYRGKDFGTLFADWDRDFPMGYSRLEKFPDDARIVPFIEEYVQESSNLQGDTYLNDSRNQAKSILTECKLFALVAFAFMMSACLYLDGYGEIEVDKQMMMQGAEMHLQNYLHLKKQFIEDGTFV